jgi:hypothetical protein
MVQAGLLAIAEPALAQPPAHDVPRFHADGTPAHWPGNTFICHIDKRSETFMAMLDIHCDLMRSGLTHRIVPLPPASYHMTVFEGISYPERSHRFPRDLPIDASESACNAAFLRKMQQFDLGCELPFRMRPCRMELQTNPYNIQLEPVDSAENRKIRGLRDRLAETLQMRDEEHDTYHFHTTLNYFSSPMTSAEKKAFLALRQRLLASFIARSPLIELQAPEFCFFDDMFEFRPQLVLHNTS